MCETKRASRRAKPFDFCFLGIPAEDATELAVAVATLPETFKPIPKPIPKSAPKPIRKPEEKRIPVRMFPVVDTARIQWLTVPIRRRFSLHYTQARARIERILDLHRLIHPSLYRDFVLRLDQLTGGEVGAETPLVLSIEATGVFPGKKREFGNFVKVKVLDNDFALPGSFVKDCKKSLSKLP